MSHDAGEVYRRVTQAFTSGDHEALQALIAEDVVWHTDDLQTRVPSTFRGRDEFFAAAATPNERIAGWEVVPEIVVSQGDTAFTPPATWKPEPARALEPVDAGISS